MSKRPVRLLMADIRTAIVKIDRYTSGFDRARFLTDDRTVDAVARNLQIIGEAASSLPKEFTDSQTGIEWRKIVGLRNRIVHEYCGVDRELVWEILQTDLRDLKSRIETLSGQSDA
ncbi:MAG: DUF86 domain-containing protein [Chloroflexi bacterium]|nr:DUF86 domain-containing protein [Chloroflexota bacterium]